LAGEVARCASDAIAARGAATVAFISCPSAFKGWRAPGMAPAGKTHSMLLEFDSRFSVFGDAFALYDYHAPEVVPESLRGACDVILLDPPFLQPDCLAAFARTVGLLRRGGAAAADGQPPTRILLATGAVMLPHARDLLGLRPTRLKIEHADGRLSNPFALFANYERAETLGGWDEEAEAAAARAEGL
jgi:hypothetical protein